jgi:hypothetical protein
VPDSLIADGDKPLGAPSGDTIPECNSLTTSADGIDNDGKQDGGRNIGTILSEVAGKILSTKNGNTTVAIGPNGGKGGGGDHPGPGKTIIKAIIDENSGKHYIPLKVPIRVFAQTEKGIVYHYITIHSDRSVNNGRIELIVCGEQKDLDMEIAETSVGTPKHNRIDNLTFTTNPLRIKIRFTDNMKHSVQTKVYYEK